MKATQTPPRGRHHRGHDPRSRALNDSQNTPCAVEGCTRPTRVAGSARGWCKFHYQRVRRTGSPTGSTLRPVEDRFMEKVQKIDDCWCWLGSDNGKGYGRFWDGSRRVYAHRWSYEHFIGPIPLGMLICHRCDNPSCVNPAHLFVGDYAANMQDCVAKGRNSPPPRKPTALTDQQRDDVRARYAAGGVTRRELEEEYGVGRGVIQWATR